MSHRNEKTLPTTSWPSVLWLIIGGILGLFAFGEWTIGIAPWLAAACFIRFSHSQGPVRGFVFLSLVRIALTAFFFSRMVPPSLFPSNVRYIAIVGGSLSATLPFLADRLIAPRLKGYLAVLVFPVAATAWEYLTFALNPMGTFGAVAYSQFGNLPLMQLVSITGLSGLTFLISWFGSTVIWSWERSFSWPDIRSVVTTYAIVLGIVMWYGGTRIAFRNSPVGTMQIASFSISDTGEKDFPNNENDAFRQKARRMQQRYFEETRRQADAGGELILWPEAAAICAKEDEATLLERGKKVAQEKEIFLAMPLYTKDLVGNTPRENKLVVVDPKGNIVIEHYKYGGNQFEGSVLGDGVLQTFQTPSAVVSGVICWDMDFPQVVRQVGRNGTDVLLAPANDWEAVSTTHAQMAVFRAVENGVSLVRHAKNGLSIAVDPFGRTLATMDHFTATERLMISQVPTQRVATVYSFIGDLFAWVTVVGFLLLAVLAVFNGRK